MFANSVVKSGPKTGVKSTDSGDVFCRSGRAPRAVKAFSQAIIPRDTNSANP
jgi:predicted RNA-binding protein YlqC (UPF0109 family)